MATNYGVATWPRPGDAQDDQKLVSHPFWRDSAHKGNYLPQTSSTLRQELRLDSLTRGLQTRWLFLDLEIGLVACAWFVDEIECHRRSL